jgi:prepilin-type N-terminal cleavage/methylation domain-containing protein
VTTLLATRERFLKDERGFTLTEMLVSMMIMTVVLIALFNIFDMSVKIFSYGNKKVEAAQNARVGLEKMEREIRQAYPIDTATGQMFYTWTPTQIRFGNDLDGNGVIACPNTSTPTKCEKIGYRLANGTTTLGRDNTSTGATNSSTLITAVPPGNLRPVAERVQSLTFTYYDSTGDEVVPVGDPDGDTEEDIDRVLVSLEISVSQGLGNPATQETLTTVIDLRNRQ